MNYFIGLTLMAIGVALFVFHEGHGVVFHIGSSRAFIPVSVLLFVTPIGAWLQGIRQRRKFRDGEF